MRAINRLAGELYAGNVHFVLELIQNADDNHYHPGCTPTLRMVAAQTKLLFVNNEVGFREKDIFALCSIGASTKKASDAGYIGNKVRTWIKLLAGKHLACLLPAADAPLRSPM